jgi:hypothetical protein
MAAVDTAKQASDRFAAALTRTKNRLTGPVAMRVAALMCVGLASAVLGVPTDTAATHIGLRPFAPGSVVVSQGGTIFGTGGSGVGTTVAANGEVDVYPHHANGDVAPEARFTQSMYGPNTLAFDPSGD